MIDLGRVPWFHTCCLFITWAWAKQNTMPTRRDGENSQGQARPLNVMCCRSRAVPGLFKSPRHCVPAGTLEGRLFTVVPPFPAPLPGCLLFSFAGFQGRRGTIVAPLSCPGCVPIVPLVPGYCPWPLRGPLSFWENWNRYRQDRAIQATPFRTGQAPRMESQSRSFLWGRIFLKSVPEIT